MFLSFWFLFCLPLGTLIDSGDGRGECDDWLAIRVVRGSKDKVNRSFIRKGASDFVIRLGSSVCHGNLHRGCIDFLCWTFQFLIILSHTDMYVKAYVNTRALKRVQMHSRTRMHTRTVKSKERQVVTSLLS